MKLILERKYVTDKAVIGELYINDKFECFTLEDPDSAGTRIPTGEYTVTLDFSNRFKRIMPHVLGNGQDKRGIRIHTGNTSANTEGCILVGASRGSNSIGMSKFAYFRLMQQLEGQKDIKLTVI